MRIQLIKTAIASVLGASLLTVSPIISAKDLAGKTIIAKGKVRAVETSSEETRRLKRRSPIYNIDKVKTEAKSNTQLRMTDGGMIALKENSELLISSYEYNAADQSGSVVMELVKGGLRSVTGAIKSDKGNYQLKTPVGSIGIRGTHYEIEIIQGEVFIAVWDGAVDVNVEVTGNEQEVGLGEGEDYSYAKIDENGEVTELLEPPENFNEGHSSDPNAGEDDDEEEGEDQQTPDGGQGDEDDEKGDAEEDEEGEGEEEGDGEGEEEGDGEGEEEGDGEGEGEEEGDSEGEEESDGDGEGEGQEDGEGDGQGDGEDDSQDDGEGDSQDDGQSDGEDEGQTDGGDNQDGGDSQTDGGDNQDDGSGQTDGGENQDGGDSVAGGDDTGDDGGIIDDGTPSEEDVVVEDDVAIDNSGDEEEVVVVEEDIEDDTEFISEDEVEEELSLTPEQEIADLVAARTGVFSYSQLSNVVTTDDLNNPVQVNNFQASMTIDFDTSEVTTGHLSFEDSGGEWFAAFNGFINGHEIQLGVNFASHGNNLADGEINSHFDEGIDAIFNSFKLFEIDNDNINIKGTFKLNID